MISRLFVPQNYQHLIAAHHYTEPIAICAIVIEYKFEKVELALATKNRFIYTKIRAQSSMILLGGNTKMKPETVLRITTLLAAGASLVLSISLYFQSEQIEDRLNGIYVGVWVPSILSLGAFLLAGQGKKN